MNTTRSRYDVKEEDQFELLIPRPTRLSVPNAFWSSIYSSTPVPEKQYEDAPYSYPCLSVQNLSKSYKLPPLGINIKALDNFTLPRPIFSTDLVLIHGPPSSGKSTLISLLALLTPATSGEIAIHHFRANRVPEHDRGRFRLSHLGLVHPSFPLWPTLSLVENVEFPMRLLECSDNGPRPLSRHDRRELAMGLLKQVGLDEQAANALPGQATEVECRLAELARAVANHERRRSSFFLLLDEPGHGLTARETVRVMDAVLHVHLERKVACVAASCIEEIQCYANRVLYLSEGRLVRTRENRLQRRLDAEKYAAYVECDDMV